jgi:hypothetical protein
MEHYLHAIPEICAPRRGTFFKAYNENSSMKQACVAVMAMFISLVAFAQEKSAEINVDINKGGDNAGNWYASPWVWVVGAAVFIILLLALTSGGSSRRRTTTTTTSGDRGHVTKTVERDVD